MRLPDKCPSCEAEGRFAACGPGVERVAEEIKKRLPDARFAIMASDTLDDPQGRAGPCATKWRNRELDLLIGTQIMAKGYHFPRLTLVGVVDARSRPRAAAIRAPPNARSSSCNRWRAAAAAAKMPGAFCCKRRRPIIR